MSSYRGGRLAQFELYYYYNYVCVRGYRCLVCKHHKQGSMEVATSSGRLIHGTQPTTSGPTGSAEQQNTALALN
jgi:hypothetical protein